MKRRPKRVRQWLLAASLIFCNTQARPEDQPQSASTPLTTAQQSFAGKDWKAAAAQSAIVAAAAGSTPAERLAALRLQARAEINLGDFAAADRTLRALLKLQPAEASALYLLGFVLQRENLPRESLEVYTRAAALRTPTADSLRQVGLDYVLLNDYPDALHWLERSLAMDARDAEAWYDLGRAQMHEGQFQSAETSFRRTLALQPAHINALDNLGLTMEAQNRLDDALKAYVSAIAAHERAHPAGTAAPYGSEQPYLNYGTLLNTRNDFSAAAIALTRAAGLGPANPRCWEELARAETGQGHNAEARAAMEHAVSLDPKNPRLHYQLGRIYRTLQMKAEADAELARSAALYGTTSSEPKP